MKTELDPDELRDLARKRLENNGPIQSGSVRDPSELIQELIIHQEELNIQNEELRRVQIELEDSRQKYFQWYEMAPVGYLTLNTDLVIKEANLTASSLLGTERNKIINKGISAFFSPNGQELLYLHYRRVASTKGNQKHLLTLRGKDDQEHLIQLESSLIKDGPDQGFRSILTDVTEGRRLEMEMARNEKLESLGVLAGGIAHDFNNMLASMVSNIEIAMIELPEQGDPRRRLTESVRSALRAQHLTKQLLTFSKGGHPVKETLDLTYLIDSSVEFSLAGSKVKADFDIDRQLNLVSADPIQMEQVINNLVVNAVQAMPQGGRLSVKARNITSFDDQEGRLERGPYVQIDITDEGTGIPEEVLNKIFEPFFTTKKTGTGLGLSTVRSIVRNHGGIVLVRSKLGKGTTFSIILPAQENAKPAPVPIAPKIEVHQSGRILVMDDEEAILEVVPLLLGHLGYESKCVRTGEEAIAAYREGISVDRPFHAVIMDLTVKGGMGGKEAVQDLLSLDPDAKVIVSSGYSNDSIMSNPQEWGFQEVLQKPFTIQDLSEKLSTVIMQRAAGKGNSMPSSM
jgi:PAS domain S-box-containing protein